MENIERWLVGKALVVAALMLQFYFAAKYIEPYPCVRFPGFHRTNTPEDTIFTGQLLLVGTDAAGNEYQLNIEQLAPNMPSYNLSHALNSAFYDLESVRCDFCNLPSLSAYQTVRLQRRRFAYTFSGMRIEETVEHEVTLLDR